MERLKVAGASSSRLRDKVALASQRAKSATCMQMDLGAACWSTAAGEEKLKFR